MKYHEGVLGRLSRGGECGSERWGRGPGVERGDGFEKGERGMGGVIVSC